MPNNFLKFIVFLSFAVVSSLGRADFKKPNEEQLRKQLSNIQYKVTQEDGTETPFKNEYWDNKEEGIYVDIVSGEPLFSSKDKFKSGTGWPSFTKPLVTSNIVEKKDSNFFITRTEIRSKNANSHLGHVFNDGPQPTGLRYCMNSAALRFIPASKLEENGLGEYTKLFVLEKSQVPQSGLKTAVFAGGCFWCTESDFEKLKGVASAVSGYIGGSSATANYDKVSSGSTKHTEAVQVKYDPKQVSYKELVAYFWKTIDPTVENRQFCDTGTQYRSGIYSTNPEELKIAQESKAQVSAKLKTKVFTEIEQHANFYVAEEYHQDYYKKNPIRYKYYRYNCGREERLKIIWGTR